MGDNLELFLKSIEAGSVVVVAGAGISKDAPSCLPSWWDYNILLLSSIGKLSAEALGMKDNLLNIEIIEKSIPVVSISEFFTDYIAGKEYFPLIGLLDGSRPNIHHKILAKLAQENKIKAIVTTNFDTLIEKSFQADKVPIQIYESPDVFKNPYEQTKFPLYKIHGSADNPRFAIDTIQQKLVGLSPEKRLILETLFENYHVLFIGFSGEDFLFGSDYIPINANKKGKHGITWISHPGSKYNENTLKLFKELDINVIDSTLTDFYSKVGIAIPDIENFSDEPSNFKKVATAKIIELLKKPYIGKWACVGLCITLLNYIGEMEEVKNIYLKTKELIYAKIDLESFNSMEYLPLLTSLVDYCKKVEYHDDAMAYSLIQYQIVVKYIEFINYNNINPNKESYYGMMLNASTVLNQHATLLSKSNPTEALENYKTAFLLAYNAKHWENLSAILINIALGQAKKNGYPTKCYTFLDVEYINTLRAAVRISEKGGIAQQLFIANCHLVIHYSILGQKKLATKTLDSARSLIHMCIKQEDNKIELEMAEKAFERMKEQEEWKGLFTTVLPNEDNLWEAFSQRPILKYKEGKLAKEKYDQGDINTCIEILGTSANNYKELCDLEAAEIFMDCQSGIFLSIANNAKTEKLHRTFMDLGRKSYEKCLILQIQLFNIRYISATLALLSQVNFLIGDNQAKAQALFQAELSLCLCNDPLTCWQATLACSIATLIHYQDKEYATATLYCDKCLEMIEIAPWSLSTPNIKRIKLTKVSLIQKRQIFKKCNHAI